MNCASGTNDRLSLLLFRGYSSLQITPDIRHQKALTGIARATLIGQQFKIAILRLDEDQPHLAAAFRAGHLNSGLKTRTGWRRSGYLHDILISNGRDASKDITREPGFRSRQNVRASTASTVLAEIGHSRFQNRPLAQPRVNQIASELGTDAAEPEQC
jgi:hypothetical protein